MSASCDFRSACTIAVALALVTRSASVSAAPDGPGWVDDEDERSAPTEPAPPSETETETESEPEPEPEPMEETAGSRDEAIESFRSATRDYELGKYAEAIAGFERAWELSGEPQLLYNMGQAYWKWFEVEPELDHLRKAKVFFQNYDKRMRDNAFYDPHEVQGHIEEIAARIDKEEKLAAERNRPVVVGPSLAVQEAELRRQRERERQYRVTRGLNATGITLIVLGSAYLVVGLAGLSTRIATGLLLDNSSGGDGGVNLASAEEDARRRQQYRVGGQVAFAGFIGGSILLPIGITLRVVGKIRERRGLGQKPQPDKQPDKQPRSVSVGPSSGLVTVRF